MEKMDGVKMKSEEVKIYLPFKARYEIGKILIEENPEQEKEAVEWILNQGGVQKDGSVKK